MNSSMTDVFGVAGTGVEYMPPRQYMGRVMVQLLVRNKSLLDLEGSYVALSSKPVLIMEKLPHWSQ